MHNREVAQIQEISEMFGISKSTIRTNGGPR